MYMLDIFKNKRIIVFDFETNGQYNRLTQPIQVYFKIINPDGFIEVYTSYVACQYRIPKNITDINGITDAMLKEQGIDIEIVFSKIRNILFEQGPFLLIGHNSLRFDNHFLNYYLQKYFTNKYKVEVADCFDTCAQLKAIKLGIIKPANLTYGEWHLKTINMRQRAENITLSDACANYGIKLNNAHTADGDGEATYQVFLKQMSEIEKNTLETPIASAGEFPDIKHF